MVQSFDTSLCGYSVQFLLTQKSSPRTVGLKNFYNVFYIGSSVLTQKGLRDE
ncbi:hypothetical protein KAT08_00815 [Candidatus Babeliales bacterium]|nr:hypothetical protein [Candidatus Babeliales bacterium]